MKRGLLIVVGCWLGVVGARAQTNFRFADSTAQWNVLASGWSFDWGPYQSRTFFTVGSDVLVNGISYQQILQQGGGWFQTWYLRKDTLGKVSYLRPDQTGEYPLYDFERLPGDTFYSTVDEEYLKDSLVVIVDAVDSVYIGKWRKRMYVHGSLVQQSWQGSNNDVLVDGIGSLNKFLFGPVSNLISTDDVTFDLLCYDEQGQLLYVNPNYNTCILGIDDKVTEIDITISPNPATTHLTIQLQQTPSSSTSFRLFDITGRMVLQKPLTGKTSRIDVSDVGKGMYLYIVLRQAQHDMERVGAGKVIID